MTCMSRFLLMWDWRTSAGTKRWRMHQAECTMAAHGWSSSRVTSYVHFLEKCHLSCRGGTTLQQWWYRPPVTNSSGGTNHLSTTALSGTWCLGTRFGGQAFQKCGNFPSTNDTRHGLVRQIKKKCCSLAAGTATAGTNPLHATCTPTTPCRPGTSPSAAFELAYCITEKLL